MDVVELLQRVSAPASEEVSTCRPFLASATELDDESGAPMEPMWAIVHSVSSAGAGLFHPQPIRTRRLVVSIEVTTGEVLRLVVDVASTDHRGPLFETAMQFLR